jgi:predicted ATPase
MERIEIQGYKSIRHLCLELRSVNILIGANGSGKSNFLSFFDLLKNMYRQNFQEYVALRGGVDKFLHHGCKVTEDIAAKLWFPSIGYFFTLKGGDQDFIITSEGFLNKEHTLIAGASPYQKSGFSELYLRNRNSSPPIDEVMNYMNELQKYHFHDTGEKSPFNRTSNIDNDRFFLYDNGQNIAALLFKIAKDHPVNYRLIVKTVQSIAPFFLDFFLQPDTNGNIRLHWQSRYDSMIYGVNDLSDGTMRFIALTVLFMQPDLPQTIIIDEPELGLHPAAIGKLSGIIQSAAAKGCQIITATQSADLIGHFAPEDIITVDQTGGASVFRRLNSETLQRWLEEYTIDDLWKRNIIDGGQLNNL